MQTIEFEAPIEGNFIRIPEQYIAEVSGCRSVKVVLTPDAVEAAQELCRVLEEGVMKRVRLEDFTELKIPTKGWKFDRAEANAR